MITLFGLIVSVLSFIALLGIAIAALCGAAAEGWAVTACAVCFMGGVQMLFLGVVGEYVGKIYLETKARPRYIISERTEDRRPKP